MLKSILAAGLLLVFSMTGAVAQSSPIQVSHVWARATAAGAKAAGVFLTLTNKGTADDKLVAVSTDVAAKAELHETTSENGVMHMQPVAGIEVKPGKSTMLKPGGYHIMLIDPKQSLVAGQKFSLSLTFEKAGKVEVTAVVEKAGAMGPAMPGMKM